MVNLTSISSALLLLASDTGALNGALEAAPRTRDIYQFPNTTWLENLAIRSNGNILTGIIGRPELWQVNPFTESASLVHSFTSVNSVFGITEYAPDVFAVAVGNYSPVLQHGSYSVWSADFHASPAKIEHVVDVRPAGVLNGLTTLSTEHQTVLAADSATGDIYRVDMRTGAYEVVLRDELTSPVPGSGKLAVNGIRIHEGYLYFTNSYRYFLGRVPIRADGTAVGEFEKIADTGLGDDFAIDERGDVYLAEDSTVVRIAPGGRQDLVVGSVNSTAVTGDTSARFGRTEADQDVLYVVTNGGLSSPVNGTYVEGGKVVAVDLKGC